MQSEGRATELYESKVQGNISGRKDVVGFQTDENV